MTNKALLLTVFAGSMALACAVCAAAPIAAIGAPKNPPPGPAVTAVDLHPAKTLLEQPCPVELVFHGEITTTRPVSVTYTWMDSRGHTWPVHRRKFPLAGVQAVNPKWKVGRPGKTVDHWVQLKVLSPENLISSKVPVHFTCAK